MGFAARYAAKLSSPDCKNGTTASPPFLFAEGIVYHILFEKYSQPGQAGC